MTSLGIYFNYITLGEVWQEQTHIDREKPEFYSLF